MKILFINSDQYDYLQDVVYSGLVKILGAKNIIDTPWNSKYHLPYKKYPKNLGYAKNSLLSINLQKFKELDAVILGACKPDVFLYYLKVLDRLPKHLPVIFIDGGDRDEIAGDLMRLGHDTLWQDANAKRVIDYIFKRELKIDKDYGINIGPLPFGWNADRMVKLPKEKKYDFAFWAGESHPIRVEALKILRGKFDCDRNGTSLGMNMYNFRRKGNEYLRELSRCKINLSLRGGGFDTLRYWEIPAVGSMMISEPPTILIPNNFVDNKSAIFCEPELTDLIDLGTYYLKNDSKREEIALKGTRHLLEYHTDVERAGRVLSAIRKLN